MPFVPQWGLRGETEWKQIEISLGKVIRCQRRNENSGLSNKEWRFEKRRGVICRRGSKPTGAGGAHPNPIYLTGPNPNCGKNLDVSPYFSYQIR